MKSEVSKKIEKLMGRMQCPKNFNCAEDGFENLCKAKDDGLEGYLVCLEEESKNCPFMLDFGSGFLCGCPLRVYICKQLQK